MKNKTLPNYIIGKYAYHLGEFSNTQYVVFGGERVNDPVVSATLYQPASVDT